jgi:hypothetical protein
MLRNEEIEVFCEWRERGSGINEGIEKSSE